MSPPAPSAPHVHDASALPVGTRLGEFELLSLLGIGGFGIVYLAFDHALEREVAVKEYMPASLAGRTETMHVSLRSQSDADTFALGLRSFVNEARLLARFDHPSLLKVLRFWEANGTAYMAMPVMRGRTLKEMRVELGRTPDEATLRSMLDALLGALERLHGEGVYHRDIAPDNIQIEPDGHPVLLDFGAARRVLSDKTQSLTAILKPAYAPIEQYAETGSVKQGPWTDFYALGATLHYVLLGKPPAPATARAVFDESSALAGQGLPGFSQAFLQMVDWMLAPKPADRPQNVAQLRQVLMGERQVPAAFLIEPSGDAWDKTQVLPHGLTAGDDATMVIPRTQPPVGPTAAPAATPASTPVFAALPAAVLAAVPAAVLSPASATAASLSSAPVASEPTVAPAVARKSVWPLAAAAAAALVVAGLVFWPRSTPAPAPAAAGAPAVGAEPTAVPQAAVTGTPAAAAAVVAPGATAPPLVGSAGAAPAAIATVPSPATSPAQSRSTPESEIKAATPVGTRPATRPAGAAPVAGSKTATGSATLAAVAPSATDTAATPPAAPAGPTAAPSPAPQATAAAPQSSRPQTADLPATPAPAAAAAGPESKCGGRNPVMHFMCMERECLRSNFTGHADCQAWRKEAKRE